MTEVTRLLLCSCAGSMAVDPDMAKAATGAQEVHAVTALCEGDLSFAEKALAGEGRTVIACGQQANFFAELAEDLNAPGELVAVDIRDRAGWSADGTAHPKQAALLAEALLPRPMTPLKDVMSEGVCLILGKPEVTLEAARALADTLAVTCILEADPGDLIPESGFDIALGRMASAQGSLGAFSVKIDGYAALCAAGRGAAGFGPAAPEARSSCDIILDLRGGAALFPAPEKRDGYVRADPGDPVAVAKAVAEAAGLQGEFEKPLYIKYDPHICAHSRASQSGCSRCLDVCPTGAITTAGDLVSIDPGICAGCGACAAVCPSGAASYSDPEVGFLFQRLRGLASAYRAAGGEAPRVLFHDGEFGAELIRLSARFGRGLPADVIPFEVYNVEGVGHAELMAALGVGFADATVLLTPRGDPSVPEREAALARALVEETRQVRCIAPRDPDALEDELYGVAVTVPTNAPILPMGGRREVTRVAAQAIMGDDRALPLPDGAPYGAVVVDTEACTLCLACASLCPVGALGDSPEKPQLRFQENACLQCGICESTCPENAITLRPQLDLRKEALSHRVLNEEDPFECITCGTPFGVKSTIERIVQKLEGNHWMYTSSDNTKLVQMCDDCRVRAQYHQENSPLFGGDRPRVRTTEDYLEDRKKPN